MKSYVSKKKFIRKSDILNKFHSLLPSEHRDILIKNTNLKPIKKCVSFENVGEQIEVNEYLNFKSNYELITISNMSSLIFQQGKGKYISPMIYDKSSKKLQKGDFLISRNASLGKLSYIHKNVNIVLNGGISCFRFKENVKFYIPAFFITKYGEEKLQCMTSGGGTQQNAKRQTLLDFKIPFPTKANNKSPENVEKLVSVIVQNIIDKEEQIKAKNELIDSLIETELRENQKVKSFEYKYPRISEIKKETRLDTGLYEKEFKKIDSLISNYKNGFFILGDSIKRYFSGTTPSFFENNNKNLPCFVRPTEISNNRTYKDLRYVFVNPKKSIRIDSEEGIILPRKGSIEAIYKPKNMNVIIGDSVKFAIFKKAYSVPYIYSFVSSLIEKFLLNKIKQKTNGGSLTSSNLNNLKIPNFTGAKQKEIAKEYYNKVEQIKDLSLDNYIEKQTQRNKQLGIFQLNMETFKLKEKLEDIIDKIINNEKIDIDL